MGRLEGRTARNAEPVDPAIGTTHMCQCIVECGLLTGTRSAEGIMASGHANRINRPNTWLHRPASQRDVLTCQLGAVHTWHICDIDGLRCDVRFTLRSGSLKCPCSPCSAFSEPVARFQAPGALKLRIRAHCSFCSLPIQTRYPPQRLTPHCRLTASRKAGLPLLPLRRS